MWHTVRVTCCSPTSPPCSPPLSGPLRHVPPSAFHPAGTPSDACMHPHGCHPQPWQVVLALCPCCSPTHANSVLTCPRANTAPTKWQEMLSLALDDAASSGGAVPPLLANTRGVVFYSTPHLGSMLASLGWKLRHVPGAAPAPSVRHLAPGPHLVEINEKLRALHDARVLRVLSFTEGQPTQLLGSGLLPKVQVVPFESAYPGFGVVQVLQDRDHIGVCKPCTRDDPAYALAFDFVRAALVDGDAAASAEAELGAAASAAARRLAAAVGDAHPHARRVGGRIAAELEALAAAAAQGDTEAMAGAGERIVGALLQPHEGEAEVADSGADGELAARIAAAAAAAQTAIEAACKSGGAAAATQQSAQPPQQQPASSSWAVWSYLGGGSVASSSNAGAAPSAAAPATQLANTANASPAAKQAGESASHAGTGSSPAAPCRDCRPSEYTLMQAAQQTAEQLSQ